MITVSSISFNQLVGEKKLEGKWHARQTGNGHNFLFNRLCKFAFCVVLFETI